MGKPIEGILLIDKAEGESSYGVVRKIKRFARKVGHAGTLDPFATGLLIILLGQATKLSDYIMSGDKTYRAVMRLGVETETLDPTGRVVATREVPDLEADEILDTASAFVGEIEQVPPSFSAVKVGGERAYKLARKGKKVELEKKKVIVHSLRILSVDLPDVEMEVTCSKGTYVRALAADMGQSLGPGGHLVSLRRVASGPFTAEDALGSGDIQKISPSDFRERVIPLRAALPGMAEMEVDGALAEKIAQGHQPNWSELALGEGGYGRQPGPVKLVSCERLLALAEVFKLPNETEPRVRVKRVFA